MSPKTPAQRRLQWMRQGLWFWGWFVSTLLSSKVKNDELIKGKG